MSYYIALLALPNCVFITTSYNIGHLYSNNIKKIAYGPCSLSVTLYDKSSIL